MNKSEIIIPEGYNIPDGADINIYCEYSNELASNINEKQIVEFFKENGRDVSVNVEDDDSYKFVSVTDNVSNSVIAIDFWVDLDETDKDDLIEAYKEGNPNLIEDIVNILKNCNSDILFDCRSKEEVYMTIQLAVYFSRYTDSIMIIDTYNGITLKPTNNELIILDN